MHYIIFIASLIMASTNFAGNYAVDNDENCDVSDGDKSEAANSFNRWVAKNCAGGFCAIADFVDRHPHAAHILSIMGSCSTAAAQILPPNLCIDWFHEEAECVANCCGWCGEVNRCMYGDKSGPNDENWNDCHNLSTWNWTGENCPHISNTTGWLITAGVAAALLAGPTYVLYGYCSCKRRFYQSIQ